jgi:hypothetical protein
MSGFRRSRKHVDVAVLPAPTRMTQGRHRPTLHELCLTGELDPSRMC